MKLYCCLLLISLTVALPNAAQSSAAGCGDFFQSDTTSSIVGEQDHAARHEISDLKVRWAKSLEELNPDAVLANYSENAILLPTLSNQIRYSHNQMRDYFLQFLSRGPHAEFEPGSVIQFLGSDHAIESGIYKFTFSDGQTAFARYTFIYGKTSSGWLIVNHHSSLNPSGH